MRTSKTLWPAHRRKVLGASCFIAKSLLEFVQRAGEIVHSRLRINRRYPTLPTRCVCLWTERRAPSLPKQTARLFGGLGSQSLNKRCNTTCDLRRKIRASDNGLKKGMNSITSSAPAEACEDRPGSCYALEDIVSKRADLELGRCLRLRPRRAERKLDRSAAMPSSDVIICRGPGPLANSQCASPCRRPPRSSAGCYLGIGSREPKHDLRFFSSAMSRGPATGMKMVDRLERRGSNVELAPCARNCSHARRAVQWFSPCTNALSLWPRFP